MREILNDIRHWAEPFAVATVVRTWRSSPRPPGAAMAVNGAGQVVGSVSGGCVEGDLYLRCQEALTTGTPALVRYGVSDDEAFEIGLTCGGTLEVFIHRIDPEKHALDRLAAAVEEREPAAVATIIEGPSIGAQILVVNGERYGSTGNAALDQAVVTDALGLLEHGTNSLVHLGRDGERRKEDVAVFVESFASPPRMLIFGAIDFAAALARLGSFMGYHVTVCDARSLFATEARFPGAEGCGTVARQRFERVLQPRVDGQRQVVPAARAGTRQRPDRHWRRAVRPSRRLSPRGTKRRRRRPRSPSVPKSSPNAQGRPAGPCPS